jgi:histidinol phosphatase-like PHP family hydrolase
MPEHLANRDPDLFDRLYRTFQPMGIEGDLSAIASLMTDYLDWLSSRKTALEAEAEAKKLEARQKLLALAAKAGITINID